MDLDEEVAQSGQVGQQFEQVKNTQSKPQDFAPVPVSDDESVVHVLQEREKRLRVELQNIKERELSRIPQDREMQVFLQAQEEQKALEEYEESLAFLRARRADTIKALRKSGEEGVRLQQVNEELKKKMSELSQPQQVEQEGNDGRGSNSLDTALAEMRARVGRVTETERYFNKKLKNILSTRCPPPDQTQVRQTLNDSQDVDPARVMDTKRMVGRLIEQSLNSPEQPYIDLDSRMWPAQVEFLIRCQIAVQHPEDPRKIKLVPFHL